MNALLEKEIPDLRQSSREVVRELGMFKAHEDYKVNCSQAHILIEVDRYGVITAKELANVIGMDKSTTSRSLSPLINSGYISSKKSHDDFRVKSLSLTKKGKELSEKINLLSSNRVGDALSLISENEIKKVVEGMTIYAKALKKSRIKDEIIIRLIKKTDNVEISSVIKSVILEFGQPVETTVNIIPEVNNMYQFYQVERRVYFVLEKCGKVIGGAGIAQLSGADKKMCELQKMYILPEYRGLGLGKKLLDKCIDQAKDFNYEFCYLDTLQHMAKAVNLYTVNGFKKLKKNISKNNHYTCNSYFMKKLSL